MAKLALALRAIRANAREHHKDSRRPDFHMLAEEILELSLALRENHEHDPWHELVQIGGVAANWIADLIEASSDAEIVDFIREVEAACPR